MKNYFFKIIAILILIIPNISFADEKTPVVKIVNYGPISAEPSEGSIHAEKSYNGAIFIMNEYVVPEFTEKTDKIYAAMELRFGVHVLVNGDNPDEIVNLVTRVTHPPFLNGQVVDEWDSPMNVNVPRFTGWLFEDEQELKEGLWTFEILYKDKVVAKKEFNVIVSDKEN